MYFSLDCDPAAVHAATLPPAAPLPALGVRPRALIVLGDLGQTSASAATVASALAVARADAGAPPAGALLLGDLSYADCDERRWDTWQALASPLLSLAPAFAVAGNHELEAPCGRPFRAFRARIPLPLSGTAAGDAEPPLWWSYDTGGVHLVGVSSHSALGPASRQLTWLDADLAAVNRSATPWVVAAMHVPWYNSNAKHQGERDASLARDALEARFLAAGVDLVLAGHVHAYERSAGGVRGARRDACSPGACRFREACLCKGRCR